MHQNIFSFYIQRDVSVNKVIVSSIYPLVGEMELQSQSLKEISKNPPRKGHVWLDRRLMDILDLKIVQKVSIGDADFIFSQALK